MLVALVATALGWPSLFMDCSIFPELGQPQTRPINHAPMALLCEPHPPTAFEWCMENCVVQGVHTTMQVNCSSSKCDCQEHCMGTYDVCLGAGASKDPTHYSLPDAIAAHSGDHTVLLEGAPPTAYRSGYTYKVTVVPGKRSNANSAPNAPTWYLIDAGFGTFTTTAGASPSSWTGQCDGTRASFKSAQDQPVDLLWEIPRNATGAVVLRVAAASQMGNLSITAAVLNSTAVRQLPASEMGYYCTVSAASTHSPWTLAQCQSLPVGTHGAVNLSTCEAECFRDPEPLNATYRCTRCAHVYDPDRDGNGVAFEDLPDDWRCPECGAPKSVYAKEVGTNGEVRWAHE